MSGAPYLLHLIEVGNRLQNIIYLLHCPTSNHTAAIDPTQAEPVMDALEQRGWKLDTILTTHHHADHTGGNAGLKAATGCTVIGSRADAARIPAIDLGLSEGERFTVGALGGTVIETSGHTLGHIAFYFEASKLLFSGDCLFSLGCGRVFEGTYAEAYTSLQRLGNLPGDTLLCPGHEYTVQNGAFAAMVEPDNEDLQRRILEAKTKRAAGQPTVPVSLAMERQINPFLRCDSPAIRRHLELTEATSLEIFTRLRQMKDAF